MNSVFHYKTIDDVAFHLADNLHSWFVEIFDNQSFIHIALSGGNTPKTLFKYLADNYKEKIAWDRIKFFWTDERCVSPDHEESNYGMAYEALIKHINVPEDNIYRIHGENAPELEAVRYTTELDKIPKTNDLPCFDLVLLGMGADGHTVSIFPDRLDLLQSDKFCEHVQHPETKQNRITITGKVVNNARKKVFFITGAGKAQTIHQILEQKPESKNYPATYITNNVKWYLDNTAAKQLLR